MAVYEPSPRTSELTSPLREFNVYAKQLKAKGIKIHPYNVGDPNKFDFDTPQYLKDAMYRVIEGKSGHYSPSEGDLSLLEAIVERENKKNGLNLTVNDVFATAGLSEAINLLFETMIWPGRGDEILLPGPTYPQYLAKIKFNGGNPVTYKTVEEDGWKPDIDDLRNKVTENTRAIVIINPNNPTGSLYDGPTVKKILDVATEKDLIVVADEIYDQITYGAKHMGVSSLTKDVPVIGLNGFSKAYLVPGWRLGYIYFHDPTNRLGKLKKAMCDDATVRLSANTPSMMACAEAFKGPQDHIAELNRKLKERGEFARKRLNEIEGIQTQEPKGAFYIFPKVINLKGKWQNDREFCLDVLENTGVYFSYGSGFDPVYGKNHFRSVTLAPVEDMDEAFGKLEKFMSKH